MKKAIFAFSIFALVAFTAAPAMARGHHGHHGHDHGDDTSIIVSNSNSAFVGNLVVSEANTGENTAAGSYAGDGGDGGSINNRGGRGEAEVEGSRTGSGGNGGSSSTGGTVYTGTAVSDAGVLNVVNSNATDIEESCGCEQDGDRTTTVRNHNRAMVLNGVVSEAETGENTAYGSYAGDGGDGGSINNGGGGADEAEVEDSRTGRGGQGGNSGLGGYVQTGPAYSSAGAVNVVNTNLTRIRPSVN